MSNDISVPAGGITEEGLRALIPLFYARVRQDPLIGPVFNDAVHDWSEHLDRLVDFWSSVMLTSGRYKGRPLPAHVKHSDRITTRSFERWLALWRETTEEMLPPAAAAALQKKAARIAESLSLGISFARGDGLTAAVARMA
jgi:hemoglobin